MATVAATASALTILSITGYNYLQKKRRREQLKREVRDALAATPPEPELNIRQFGIGQPAFDNFHSGITSRNFDESIIREMLARNYAFLGEEAMGKVRGGRVVVVGCGGVGSWAAVMLLRS